MRAVTKLAVLIGGLALTSCNFEFGHEVPRHQVIGRIDARAVERSFSFTTRGTASFVTLAAPDAPVVPARSTIWTRIVDGSGTTQAENRTSGGALQVTNWDAPEASVLIYPQPPGSSELARGQRHTVTVRIEPPPDREVVVVHHWLSQHGE